MKTTKATTATTITMMPMMTAGLIAPVRPWVKNCASACGICATMPVKMISEMPLPMPREVICSPSHIRNIVPPTSVTITPRRKYQPGIVRHALGLEADARGRRPGRSRGTPCRSGCTG